MSRNKKITCEGDSCVVETTITHILLDFQLPPPIYGEELTTYPSKAERTIKYVNSISKVEGGVIVKSAEGIEYHIPQYRIKYWREE